ncbi:hypothetical protein [Spongiactinospora sp. 9N601]|uniref:hypothetical protein n=1 Tax=Spongiactinospora sp. 9N601 TaxID=3375149 RepID=UPI0037AE03C2
MGDSPMPDLEQYRHLARPERWPVHLPMTTGSPEPADLVSRLVSSAAGRDVGW